MVLRLERKKLDGNGGGPFVPAPAWRVDRALRLGVVVAGAARPTMVILRLVSRCDPWHRGGRPRLVVLGVLEAGPAVVGV